MFNVIVVMQHCNWEDDGGEHDPMLVTVDQAMFNELSGYIDGNFPPDAHDLARRLRACATPALPCQIEAVFNVWHDF